MDPSIRNYLERHKQEIIDRVESTTRPLLPANETPEPIDALRKPYEAQHRVIIAARRTLETQPATFIIGEMGTGKTLIGSLIPEPGTKTIILCPGHLTEKWEREILKTVPNATATILRTMKDCRNALTPTPKDRTDFYILSKETGKLGYLWKSIYKEPSHVQRPILIKNKEAKVYDKATDQNIFIKRDFPRCPNCSELIEHEDKKGNIISVPIMKIDRSKTFCKCGAALWQADRTRTRKIALAEYLKRIKAKFDFLILDEAHEFKSADSAQANAFGSLCGISEKKILLTGTLIGGYATHLYYLLWRIIPITMKSHGYEYNNAKLFIEQYGVIETTIREYTGETSYNKRSKGSSNNRQTSERPGISPELFTDYLLGAGIFLQLDDLGANLPKLTETPIAIELDPNQEDAYKVLESRLRGAIAADLARGNKRLLGKLLVNLLAYPDKPFDLSPIDLGDGRYIFPTNLDAGATFPKEDKLIELALDARARGDKVLVYCQFTNSRDIQPRLQEKLEAAGIKTAILRSNTKPELRERWIEEHQDIDALICNPELVKTGLDLYDYTTIIYFQTGYNIFTLRQASRRSWRLGQTKPVNIFYLFYQDTMQHRAIDLIARKLSAATALDGKLSADGLNALAEEDDAMALARALLDGLTPSEKIELPTIQTLESLATEDVPDALNYDKLTGQDQGLEKFIENHIFVMSPKVPLPIPTPEPVVIQLTPGQIKEYLGYTPAHWNLLKPLPTLSVLTTSRSALIPIPEPVKPQPEVIPAPTPTPQAKQTTGLVKDFEYYRKIKAARIANKKAGLGPTEFPPCKPRDDQLSLFG